MNGKIGELRPSQLITTFGPGAIVDLPDFSVIIAGLDFWPKSLCSPISEPRLARKLGIRKILSPPVSDSENSQGTLPAFRFPRFLVCPKCRRLGREDQFDLRDDVAYCRCDPRQPPKAFPSRFIVACPRGHVADIPWHHYVHGKKKNFSCPGRDLRLNDRGVTGSIADVEVECRDCGERRTLQDAFRENRPEVLGPCSGHRHWLGPSARETCPERVRAMLRGASNAYFAVVESALSIPPYTSPVHAAVAAVADRLTRVDSLDKLQMLIETGVFPEFEPFSASQVWRAIQEQSQLPGGPEQDLLYPEWQALLAGSQPGGEHEFETEEQAVPEGYETWIARLVMVRRLVEVRVLDGFTRIDPPPDVTLLMSRDEETGAVSVKARLSRENLDWRPGVLTRGEGIFLALNEEELRKWESRPAVEAAERAMAAAYDQYLADREIPPEQRPPFPGARYVLLHTLAHALIRQLCLNSGYSSTALRERIYSRKDPEQHMAGLLIYTATPDSEGSLGGLVELGQTERFGGVLWRTLQEASFCSSDPLCAEHKPDAVGDLNGAACHACSLAAETSCERSNRFLDRSFLVPTVSGSELAFFHQESHTA